MERIVIDSRSEYTARAADGENVVLVGWDVLRDRMVYSMNGGPPQTVARQIRSTYINPTRIAMELLYEHATQCQAIGTEEELTLP